MFSFFSPYKVLIEAVAIGALILGIAFGIHHFLSYEQQIGYDKAVAEYTAKELEATKAARAREQALAAQLSEAQNAAAIREQTIKTLASAAAVSSGGLRDTIAGINARVPNDSVLALGNAVRTLGQVFTECEGRRRQVAEDAERLNSEKRTLVESWPK